MTEGTRYASLVGKRVEAYYRAGGVRMSALGILVADDGKSISIEERFSQAGRSRTVRVAIPYDYLISIAETNGDPPPDASAAK